MQAASKGGHNGAQPPEGRDHFTFADWRAARKLLRSPDILALFWKQIQALGVVGEEKNAKLLYIAIKSRLSDRPISIFVLGASGGGKSFVVECTLQFFPKGSFHFRTSGSPKSLLYTADDLKHRTLVLAEAAGFENETLDYLLRTLLSEGRLEYETVESVEGQGLRPRKIVKEGPTRVIVTSTRKPHLENATRMLELHPNESAEQTRLVLADQARRAALGGTKPPDLKPCKALQLLLSKQPWKVVIPFAEELANSIPPDPPVRFRRGFPQLLRLIEAHAFLHQRTRKRDKDGQILATLDDYAAVHALVHEQLSEGAARKAPQAVLNLVDAVQKLQLEHRAGVPLLPVTRELGIDKSQVSRRGRDAIELGLLVNAETRNGYPARLKRTGASVKDECLLPTPEALRERCRKLASVQTRSAPGESSDRCTVETVAAEKGAEREDDHHPRAAAIGF